MKTSTNIDIDLSFSSIENIDNDLYLVLTKIQDIPPHCSLLLNKRWYSLNYQGCKLRLPLSYMSKAINVKKEGVVFLALDLWMDEKTVLERFSEYTCVAFEKQITCISPIKNLLIEHHIKISDKALLFEMIEKLYDEKKVTRVGAFNYNKQVYELKHYSIEDLTSQNYELNK